MNIKVIGSTKKGYVAPVNESLRFGSIAAGICYLSSDYDTLNGESPQRTERRMEMTLKSGHHSVYDHPSYNFLFEGIPKILAMVLNNEGFYTTSEKSARYTPMTGVGREQELYLKWKGIFERVIALEYPRLDKRKITKLAMENARYMLSVFTPTTMAYSVSLRQISTTIGMMKNFIDDGKNNDFYERLKSVMGEFVEKMTDFDVPDLNGNVKGRTLSLFDTRAGRKEGFCENYSVNYMGSFAQLAQIQRHRTLDYTMKLPGSNPSFFVPPILGEDLSLRDEWLSDMGSLTEFYVQGMLVSINERGTYENFILKVRERLCADAQLETSLQTGAILLRYLEEVRDKNEEVHNILTSYVKNTDGIYKLVPRCGFKGYICPNPCMWKLGAMKRKI